MEKGKSSHVDLRVSPERVTWALVTLAAILIIARLTALFFRYALGHGRILGFYDEFSLGLENNIPTYVSSLLLATAAIILALLAKMKRQQGDRWTLHWRMLSLIFLIMSVDEMASLHERFSLVVKRASDLGAAFHYSWVAVGLVVVPLVGLAYLWFLVDLRRKTAWLFIIAGMLYVGGALGMEMVSGG